MGNELSISAWLEEQARINGVGPALLSIDGQSALDFATLNKRVAELAALLAESGFGPGTVTAVALPDSAETLILLLALMQVSAVLPVQHTISDEPFVSLLERSGANAVIGTVRPASTPWRVAEERGLPYGAVDLRPRVFGQVSLTVQRQRPVMPREKLSTDDPALYIATSGTTGDSKIVAITQRSLDLNIATHGRLNKYGPGTRSLCVMPFTYLFAYVRSSLPMLRMGGSVGVAPGYRFKDVRRWCENVRPTCFASTPSILKRFIADAKAADWRPGNGVLKRIHSTGEAIPASLGRDVFDAFGADLATNYGMTETSPQVAVSLPEDELPAGAAGRVVSPWRVSILDDNGGSLPAGQVGRVALSGGLFNAIVGTKEETRLDAMGRLPTGDRGFLDDHGVLHLAGRVDDVINRGGEKIDPRIIELALETDADVERAVVFGLPDKNYGHKVWAIVKLRDGTVRSSDAIKSATADLISGWGLPERLISVSDIPVNKNGKVSRSDLAARYSDSDPVQNVQ
ncbi:class I adenylate-forming enzyme family protein [Hoeflea sp.]|uniref:class I adenylate-forming enzyme family protein n=1 Tax=Hoeflea sp. TaxID=1940281 RepID=UPI003B025ABF